MIKFKKNKKAQMGSAVIVGLVFAIILAVIGVQIAGDLGTTATTLTNVNQTIGVIVNDTNYNLTLTVVEQGIVTSTVNITNGTFSFNTGNFSVTSDGDLDLLFSGAINISNVRANYDYQQYGYVTGVASTMILLIPLFIALATLGITVLFFKSKT